MITAPKTPHGGSHQAARRSSTIQQPTNVQLIFFPFPNLRSPNRPASEQVRQQRARLLADVARGPHALLHLVPEFLELVVVVRRELCGQPVQIDLEVGWLIGVGWWWLVG